MTVVLTITRKPVPYERPDEYVKEISISRDRPSIALTRVCLAMIMKSVNERRIDQRLRPDH